MKSLLFIESPIQLINAYEAINKYSIKKYKIIVRFSKVIQNDEQIQYVIDKLKIQNIKYITIGINNRNIKDYLQLFYYKYLYKVPQDIDKIFIGNYDSGFLNLIIKKVTKDKIVLLDDGAKTIDIQAKFTDLNNYNLFTMYDFKAYKNQEIIKNDFINLQTNLQQLKINQEQILFLGLKLSEIGIVTQEYYVELINKIALFYQGKQIIYISHRGETKTKLDKLKNIKNLEVIQLDYPVELYGLYNEEIPYKVSSFYSTALLTMKNIYGIEAESFMFDYNNSKYKDSIDNVYDYYKENIYIRDLNETI